MNKKENVLKHFVDNLCEYDGKVGMVIMGQRWHVFLRANLKLHGGRFVQVATSSSGIAGLRDSRLHQIEVEGYDKKGPGNIYFAAVDNNPLDNLTMLGLFPVNSGVKGAANGDGESFIGLALSCDGLHWSSLTKLVWTTGKDGRTYDQPVDGQWAVQAPDGRIRFYVHNDVPFISPRVDRATIVEYELHLDALHRLTHLARAALRGCPRPDRL